MQVLSGVPADRLTCLSDGLSLAALLLITAGALVAGAIFLARWFSRNAGRREAVTRREIGIWSLIVAVPAVLLPLIGHKQAVFVARGNLIDQGCSAMAAYEHTYPLVQLSFDYSYYKATGKKARHTMIVRNRDAQQVLSFDIGEKTSLPNLKVIAPQAMRAYAERLQALGQPLPSELRDLETGKPSVEIAVTPHQVARCFRQGLDLLG